MIFRTKGDFPRTGVSFKDLAPLYADPVERLRCVETMASQVLLFDHSQRPSAFPVRRVFAVGSRGYITGALLAAEMVAPLYLLRSPNKTPPPCAREYYQTEYSEDCMALAEEDIPTEWGMNIIVDDVLATGGTLSAAYKLVNSKIMCPTLALTLLDIGIPGSHSVTGMTYGCVYNV